MNAQNKSILYSIFGGLLIIVFWVYINQIKSESQLPFWDIMDFANETDSETTQENLEYTTAQTPTDTQQSNATVTDQNNQPASTQLQTPITWEPAPPTPTPRQTPQPNHTVTTPQPTPQQTPPIVKKPLGSYNDGTYEATSSTPWGDMSVSIIVKNGKWSNIRYLQIPDSPPSQYAASYLAQQALQKQNASIDGVSGATYTTEAFRDDLNQIVQQSKI